MGAIEGCSKVESLSLSLGARAWRGSLGERRRQHVMPETSTSNPKARQPQNYISPGHITGWKKPFQILKPNKLKPSNPNPATPRTHQNTHYHTLESLESIGSPNQGSPKP